MVSVFSNQNVQPAKSKASSQAKSKSKSKSKSKTSSQVHSKTNSQVQSKTNSQVEPKTRLSGLLAPLQRLDQRLQQTIEVAQLLQGSAFQTCLMGSIQPPQQPAEAVVKDSLLYQLAQKFGLSAFDVGVIVMAIAPELDRRYERLYASLQLLHQSHHSRADEPISARSLRKPSVDLALNLLCSGSHDQLAQQTRFAPRGQGHAFGVSPLMRLLQPIDPDLQTLRQQILQLNPAVSRYLLGQRSLDPSLSPFCAINWSPTQAASSHRLSPTLLSTIHTQAKNKTVSPPLIVQLGQQPNGKRLSPSVEAQSAEVIAAAANAPLLRVNLNQLAHTAQYSEIQSQQSGEQVLLQGQLWNAVIYVESTSEVLAFQRRMVHPKLIKARYDQLATHPGITVFADSPFCESSVAIAHQPQRPWLGLMEIASPEIESFRQKLMQSSTEPDQMS